LHPSPEENRICHRERTAIRGSTATTGLKSKENTIPKPIQEGGVFNLRKEEMMEIKEGRRPEKLPPCFVLKKMGREI